MIGKKHNAAVTHSKKFIHEKFVDQICWETLLRIDTLHIKREYKLFIPWEETLTKYFLYKGIQVVYTLGRNAHKILLRSQNTSFTREYISFLDFLCKM